MAGRQAGQSETHHMVQDIFMMGNETQPRGWGAAANSDTCFWILTTRVGHLNSHCNQGGPNPCNQWSLQRDSGGHIQIATYRKHESVSSLHWLG